MTLAKKWVDRVLVARIRGRRAFQVELPPELESVAAGRKLVAEAARCWAVERSVAEDAVLAVSELVTNSVLHAGGPVGVSVRRLGRGIRVEVRDRNGHLPVADAARPEHLCQNSSMTGRGLAVVGVTTDRWGADPLPEGKVTWAEIGTRLRLLSGPGENGRPRARAGRPGGPRLRRPRRPQRVVDDLGGRAEGAPRGWRTIRLRRVPVRLVQDSTRQLCDLEREVRLMSMDRGTPPQLERVISAGRRLAEQIEPWMRVDQRLLEGALARGNDRIDLDMAIPPDAADAIDRLMTWLRRVRSTAARRHLLAAPPSEEVTAFRLWLREEILSQLAGSEPSRCPLATPSRSGNRAASGPGGRHRRRSIAV